MLEAKELNEAEVIKQVVLFTHTLRSILQRHRLCRNQAVVASYSKDTQGEKLIDDLCDLIKTPAEEVMPMDIDQEKGWVSSTDINII